MSKSEYPEFDFLIEEVITNGFIQKVRPGTPLDGDEVSERIYLKDVGDYVMDMEHDRSKGEDEFVFWIEVKVNPGDWLKIDWQQVNKDWKEICANDFYDVEVTCTDEEDTIIFNITV